MFQQDGSRPHAANAVHFINKRFFMIGSPLIDITNSLELDGFGNHTFQIWIPMITSWWFLKEYVIRRNLHIVEEVKAEIAVAIKSIPNWLSYEKFNLTFANGVGCIGINLNMILCEWNLPCFIRVVVSEPVLWVRYINKYRHLKQLCSFSLNPVYFVV